MNEHPSTRRAYPASILRALPACLALGLAVEAGAQGLPPVPFPPENPPTEAKRVLGKILFWDEQLSSDGSVACGTCHIPSAGGADPRPARHPGFDGSFGTADDVHGSAGVVRRNAEGEAVEDAVFGFAPQVTGRAAPSFFAGLYARETFWDGRASSTFVDPLDGATVRIARGGALESQAVGPILNSVEMAREGRDWDDVAATLGAVRPLGLADRLPADAAAAIAASPSYGELFAAAFGDQAITPTRIAFAIATYERSLVPSATPWDRFIAGEAGAMTASQVQGWNVFRAPNALCSRCHVPPQFTNDDFLNVGLRPAVEDEGRLAVSGLDEDLGDMKVPGLRNVGLRETLMHTGAITGVGDAVDFYLQARGHQFFLEDQDGAPPTGTPLTNIRIAPADRAALVDFLAGALTDPRAAAGEFPFDKPRLASEGAAPLHCDAVPRSDCREAVVAGTSRVSVTADVLRWKATALAATSLEDLGDPTAEGGLALCFYEGDAPAVPSFEASAAADGDCGDGSCWRTVGNAAAPRGYRYQSPGGQGGLRKVVLRAGTDGRAKVVVQSSGEALVHAPLGAPALPMALPLVVQVQSTTGACWSATYAAAAENGAAVFAAR